MANIFALRKGIIVTFLVLVSLYLLQAVCGAVLKQAVGGGTFAERFKDEFIDHMGMNKLHYAAQNQEPFWVNFFLGLGWGVNSRDNYNRTALHLVTSYGDMNTTRPEQLEISKILINKGANINAVDNEGKTPLMDAAFHARLELSEFLIKNGASVNLLDNKLKSALDYSRSIAGKPITRELRNYGAEFGAEVTSSGDFFVIKPKGSNFRQIDIPSTARVQDIEAQWSDEYKGYVLEFVINMNQTCNKPMNCNSTSVDYLNRLRQFGIKIHKADQKPFLLMVNGGSFEQKQYDEAYYWSITDCKTPFYVDISNYSRDLKVRIFITERPFGC